MDIFKKSYKITKIAVVISVLVFIVIGCLYYYFKSPSDSKLSVIISGVCSSLLVAIIQLIIEYEDFKRNEIFSQLKLKRIMSDRNEIEFYRNYIKEAKTQIDIMGVTSSRFFNDFAELKPEAPEKNKILLSRLVVGVSVRILLPSDDFLSAEKVDAIRGVQRKLSEIRKEYPNCSFAIKRFDHKPYHSIFRVDDSCIVGPIFPEKESRYTTSLHLENSSELAKFYLNHFEKEWESAHE